MQDNVRFSMKEWKPPTLEDKLFRLEQERWEVDKQKEPFIEAKMKLEKELSELKGKLSTEFLPDSDYRIVRRRQMELNNEKFAIEDAIKGFRMQSDKLNREIDDVQFQLKKAPNTIVKEELTELRDKYMQFASDTTRVSSMRAMSSKFVEEIQLILKLIK